MSGSKPKKLGNLKNGLLVAQKNVFDILKCPCCWRFVGVHFEQCSNSHVVCARCRAQIPNCPVCRAVFLGKPLLLSAIVEQLIQIFPGLSSGDKAVDVFLKQQLTPITVPQLTPITVPQLTPITVPQLTPITVQTPKVLKIKGKTEEAKREEKADPLTNFQPPVSPRPESPIYDAKIASKSLKTFLEQQGLMFHRRHLLRRLENS